MPYGFFYDSKPTNIPDISGTPELQRLFRDSVIGGYLYLAHHPERGFSNGHSMVYVKQTKELLKTRDKDIDAEWLEKSYQDDVGKQKKYGFEFFPCHLVIQAMIDNAAAANYGKALLKYEEILNHIKLHEEKYEFSKELSQLKIRALAGRVNHCIKKAGNLDYRTITYCFIRIRNDISSLREMKETPASTSDELSFSAYTIHLSIYSKEINRTDNPHSNAKKIKLYKLALKETESYKFIDALKNKIYAQLRLGFLDDAISLIERSLKEPPPEDIKHDDFVTLLQDLQAQKAILSQERPPTAPSESAPTATSYLSMRPKLPC